jgi:flagella synthesis protein FlgN
MKASEALSLLLRDLQADRAGYGRLRGLLDEQFQAALAHRSERLASLADEIVSLVDELNGRGLKRGALLQQLAARPGEAPSMGALLRRLPEPLARSLGQAWQALELLVQDCKAVNQRNCHLITEQHALMQRVLGVEEVLYAER